MEGWLPRTLPAEAAGDTASRQRQPRSLRCSRRTWLTLAGEPCCSRGAGQQQKASRDEAELQMAWSSHHLQRLSGRSLFPD